MINLYSGLLEINGHSWAIEWPPKPLVVRRSLNCLFIVVIWLESPIANYKWKSNIELQQQKTTNNKFDDNRHLRTINRPAKQQQWSTTNHCANHQFFVPFDEQSILFWWWGLEVQWKELLFGWDDRTNGSCESKVCVAHTHNDNRSISWRKRALGGGVVASSTRLARIKSQLSNQQ